MKVFLCSLGALLTIVGGVAGAQDLGKINRTLGKQPAYASKEPKYCLLVFGPKAETRVWLVLDLAYDPLREKPGNADSLYADLNGDGDLTGPKERIPVTVVTKKGSELGLPTNIGRFEVKDRDMAVPRFHVGDVTSRNGKTTYAKLVVDVGWYIFGRKDRQVTVSVDAPGFGRQSVGGPRVAAGDVNGDGRAEIITGAGPGGGPNVTVYELVGGQPQVLQSYFAFDLHFSDGIFVGSGDVNGDGKADVIAGSGPISGGDAQFVNKPTAAVFSGVDASSLARYPALPQDSSFLGAVRVAATDSTGSGKASVVTVHGPGGTPDVDILDGLTGTLVDKFFVYNPNFTGGIFLANTPR